MRGDCNDRQANLRGGQNRGLVRKGGVKNERQIEGEGTVITGKGKVEKRETIIKEKGMAGEGIVIKKNAIGGEGTVIK